MYQIRTHQDGSQAIIHDDLTIPFDEGNRDYQEYLAWVAEGNAATTWEPPPLTPEQMAEQACARRDALLSETDWYAVRYAETGKAIPAPVLAYRQALRDIDQQPGYPEAIDWPVLPEGS
jgi:hypothetical protein